jgi:putative tryptophan/tyrosine transport system substrate-binding protein
MNRRAVLAAISVGALSVWSAWAKAQQPDGVRRIEVLMGGLSEGDPAGLAELAAFEAELKGLGWAPGRNLKIDIRWPGADLERVRQFASSVAASRPHLVLSRATPATVALRNEAPSLPTVFVLVAEPVDSGIVQSLARPGGSVTGFSNFDGSIGAKWLELLKELSPSLNRVAVLHNPQTAPFAAVFVRSVEAGALALGVEVVPAPVVDDIGIENAIAAIGRTSGGGLVGITDTFVNDRRRLIIELAARYGVPAVYGNRSFTPDGGLIAFAADYPDLFRRAAAYVDRILNGVKPGDLPVQQPTRFELSINMGTARALGLGIPASLLARADEIIE